MDVSFFRFLDSKDATSLEYKLDSFSSVYRRLTGKDVRVISLAGFAQKTDSTFAIRFTLNSLLLRNKRSWCEEDDFVDVRLIVGRRGWRRNSIEDRFEPFRGLAPNFEGIDLQHEHLFSIFSLCVRRRCVGEWLRRCFVIAESESESRIPPFLRTFASSTLARLSPVSERRGRACSTQRNTLQRCFRAINRTRRQVNGSRY